MILLLLALFNPLTLFVLYVLYTRSTGLQKKALTVFGGIVDMVVNITWFSIIFLEWPREWLLTKRVSRLNKKASGWRGNLANLICKILNYFEKDHCK